MLSTLNSRGSNTLRLILSNGTHQVSVGLNKNESFDIYNQFVSYTVNSSDLMVKQNEQPLRFIGKWKFDPFGNGRDVMYYSFMTDNTGYLLVYEDGVPYDICDFFKYSFTDTILTIQYYGTFSMEYTLNENEMSLKNFWGSKMTVTGIRQ